MRRRSFPIAVGVALVAVVSGTAVTSASAAVFTLGSATCSGGTFKNLCWSNAGVKQELEGEQTFTITLLGVGVLRGTIGGEAVEGQCEELTTGAAVPSVFKQPTPLSSDATGTATVLFKKCKLTGSAVVVKKCKIPVEKESNILTGHLASVSELVLSPQTGTEFIVIPFENNGAEVCPATIKGNRAITGTQAAIISEPEVPQEEKTGKAVVKSGLKLAGEPAELEGTVGLSLTGLGDLWVVSVTS
jgi:hypothetical protein